MCSVCVQCVCTLCVYSVCVRALGGIVVTANIQHLPFALSLTLTSIGFTSSLSSCPDDIPTNSSGSVGCNFIDEDSNTKFCALTCATDAECGTGAKCFVDTFLKMGFCGYP